MDVRNVWLSKLARALRTLFSGEACGKEGANVISEELLQAVRRRSIARQRLTDARKMLQTAEIEMANADKNVRDAEQAERKELAL